MKAKFKHAIVLLSLLKGKVIVPLQYDAPEEAWDRKYHHK